MSQWVHSNIWNRPDAEDISHRMESLAYNNSSTQVVDCACEVCPKRKGNSHLASHQLSYFGSVDRSAKEPREYYARP
jgi:hypothetical protein